MKVRILFVVNSLRFGGAEKHVVTLLNQLDPARFHVALAYLKAEHDLLPQLDTSHLAGGVFCVQVQKKLDRGAATRLADAISTQQIDIIVCTNNYPLWYGWFARKQAGSRAALVEVLHSTELGALKYHLHMLLSRPFYLACQRIVYVCESQRTFWRKRLLSLRADEVIHNGIDIAHFTDRYSAVDKLAQRQQYGASGDDFVLGICAALRVEKAHGDLLAALARLRAQGTRNLKVWLIGDGPMRGQIEAKIAELGLADCVSITGFMADVRPLVASCDAMTLVSHSETFSLAALEAMALGKPMLMTMVGGAGEQIEHGVNGYLFPVGDIGALADSILKLMVPGHAALLGQKARTTVEQNFSIGVMTEKYQNLFQSLARSAHER
jgi:glycosyltransferase involved in cell wall biosynthesis